jgi:hypothetical protein
MRPPYRILVLPLLLVAGVSLACMIHVGGPDLPGPVVPVSSEAVDQVQESLESARLSTQPGELVSLTFTESQLSSVLASRLESQSDPWITNPQVYLEDGYIEVYGQASKGFLAGNVHLTVDISIDENGNPELAIQSGDMGPVALPEWLLDKLSTLLDESLTGTIGPVVTGIRIEGVVIDDGVMVILGRFRDS